jgi:hypothetical protein
MHYIAAVSREGSNLHILIKLWEEESCLVVLNEMPYALDNSHLEGTYYLHMFVHHGQMV